LAAVSAVSWALYSNLARRWGSPQGGAAPLFVLATACGLGLLRLLRPETTCWSLKGALEVAFMGVVSQGMAYNLWDHGMRRGNHVLLSLSSYFVPVASLLLASVYLAVVPHASVLIGCALVVAGAVICLMSLEASTP
jgi:drug/metabolite transporter (DMT)-like permease